MQKTKPQPKQHLKLPTPIRRHQLKLQQPNTPHIRQPHQQNQAQPRHQLLQPKPTLQRQKHRSPTPIKPSHHTITISLNILHHLNRNHRNPQSTHNRKPRLPHRLLRKPQKKAIHHIPQSHQRLQRPLQRQKKLPTLPQRQKPQNQQQISQQRSQKLRNRSQPRRKHLPPNPLSQRLPTQNNLNRPPRIKRPTIRQQQILPHPPT